MGDYHRYVFDTKKRRFVGAFERMYHDEDRGGFDSWHQDDSRHPYRRMILALLQDYNFPTVVDLGCGKGAFTHLLKRRNNRVVGLDGSKTALKRAAVRYPDIEFRRADLNAPEAIDALLGKICRKADLICAVEVLSYLSRWKELLRVVAKRSEYALFCLYIPEDPIGEIKTESALVSECERRFEILEWISLRKSRSAIVFARRKRRTGRTSSRLKGR